MKRWNIWADGYLATGENAPARILATGVAAPTFREACAKWATTTSNPKLYDPKFNTYWGCRLHDNERAARKANG